MDTRIALLKAIIQNACYRDFIGNYFFEIISIQYPSDRVILYRNNCPWTRIDLNEIRIKK